MTPTHAQTLAFSSVECHPQPLASTPRMHYSLSGSTPPSTHTHIVAQRRQGNVEGQPSRACELTRLFHHSLIIELSYLFIILFSGRDGENFIFSVYVMFLPLPTSPSIFMLGLTNTWCVFSCRLIRISVEHVCFVYPN